MVEDVEVKKKGKGGLIFCLLLILIIIGLVCYILVDKGIVELPFIESNSVSEKDSKKSNDTKEEENYTDINIDDASVLKLFKEAHNPWSIGPDQYIFNNTKLVYEDMDVNYRMSLASNVFKDKNTYVSSTNKDYYKFDDVKDGYEEVFGPNTFNNLDKFSFGCGDYEYNSATKEYINSNSGCGGAVGFLDVEQIISAKKYDDRIEIVSAAAFISGDDNTLYRDYNRKTSIKDFGSDAQSMATLEAYVRENSQYLEQYTYTYKLNNNGFYYYYGVERTQE